jgi:hypothetical protein
MANVTVTGYSSELLTEARPSLDQPHMLYFSIDQDNYHFVYDLLEPHQAVRLIRCLQKGLDEVMANIGEQMIQDRKKAEVTLALSLDEAWILARAARLHRDRCLARVGKYPTTGRIDMHQRDATMLDGLYDKIDVCMRATAEESPNA